MTSRKPFAVISDVCRLLICGIILVFFFILSIVSLISTADLNTSNHILENVDILIDNIPVNLLVLLLSAAFLYFAMPILRKIPVCAITIIMCVWVISFGLFWVIDAQSMPNHDSYIVTNAAYEFATNNYKALNIGETEYFHWFPFQLGYTFFCEIIFRIKNFFGGTDGNTIILQSINVIALSISLAVFVKIAGLVFRNKNAQKICGILFIFCIQPILFCTFTYGNLTGFLFAVMAIWQGILLMQKNRIINAVLFAIFSAISIMLKLNNAIILIAMCIIVLLHFLREIKWQKLFGAILAVLLTIGLNSAIIAQYEMRSGENFYNGIPMVCWLSMGLGESEICDGWYNSAYTIALYDANSKTQEIASQTAIKSLKMRLNYFTKNPAEAINFFATKLTSQFNEPTYSAIWTTQTKSYYDESGELTMWLFTDGESTAKSYMNFFQQFIFVFSTIGMWKIFRNKQLVQAIIPLILLGAIAYHTLFEAKSQYIMTYFILLIPVAAVGFELAWRKTRGLIKKPHSL